MQEKNTHTPTREELQPCTWLNPKRKEDTFYHITGDKPFLVLWSRADPNNIWPDPNWKSPEDWTKIYHQTAGYACMHMTFWAKFLKPKPKMKALMEEISKNYYESCLWAPASLHDAIEYETRLITNGLTANRTHHDLQEGFYPIDIECLKKVTSDNLPEDLADLVKPQKGKKGRWARLWAPHMSLAILTENCD